MDSSNDTGLFGRLFKKKRRSFVPHYYESITKMTHDYSCAEEIGTGVEVCDWSVHLQPQPEAAAAAAEEEEEEATVLGGLFDAISALKLAYIQLQQAHIPYQPKKLREADELIVSEFDSLSKLQLSYVGKPSSLCSEIRNHEKRLEELQTELRLKDSEAVRLRREVDTLNRKNVGIEKRAPSGEPFPLLDREWTPGLFSGACRSASKSVHDFTKVLIGLMKASGWDLDRAAACIDSSVAYRERLHKKFAFESYLSLSMLGGGGSEEDCFEMDRFDCVVKFADPFDALVQYPDSGFGRFCRLKYLAVVKARMEGSFFGNLDQREFVVSYGHPRTPFYRAFVGMARWVWALQVMGRSFIPKAEMFYAKRGAKFEEEYMESVVKLLFSEEEDEEEEGAGVGLTVMPGFKIGNNVIRCRVYPCRMKF
ncbi:uncharacterized protein M6B38_405165 [Iris pallida]|uniref:DUF641 domain-containing protein n=1 Tax=Iris pallida TaxID=29817 RepID=A0AAX6FSS4_IRIPA|nr:uncharacterized protein M6B38_405165 [Iris pallida]